MRRCGPDAGQRSAQSFHSLRRAGSRLFAVRQGLGPRSPQTTSSPFAFKATTLDASTLR